MPLLKFEVQADYEKVIKLREEISKLEEQLRSFNPNATVESVRKVETELATAKGEFQELINAAILAGAKLEDGFKKKIYDASTVVNDLTKQIIEQKENVRLATITVREFADQYKEALKNGKTKEAADYKETLKKAKDALEQERSAMFNLTQEQAKARLSVKELTDEYKLFKEEAGDCSGLADELASRLGNMGKNVLGIIGAGTGIKDFISNMVATRAEFQSIETSLEVLLGSEEKAVKLMGEVKDFAKVSPLDLKSTAAATQMMLGFNIEAEKVPRYLQAIGDISMGDTARFNSLTLAFSQMSATGKLMGQDLNQMINAGFNPLSIMAEKTGKSIGTLKEEMSKGAISASMVQQAFIDATESGGKFYQMSERASQTIDGQISMLQDAMDAMFNSMGEANEGFILDVISATTSLVENYETVGAILLGLIATYGTYRAAVIVHIALTEGLAAAAAKDAMAKGLQTAATKAATLAQAAYNAVANANPYVLLATAVVGVASALVVYATRTNDAEDAQKRLNKAVADADAAFSAEQINIDILFDKLKQAKQGTEEYAQAQKAIIDQYGEYLGGLVDEKNKLLDIETAYQRVTAAARESANARAMESYTQEISDSYQKSYQKNMDQIRWMVEKGVSGKNAQNSLLRLISQDISTQGKLSAATINSIEDAVNKSKKWSTGGSAFATRVGMFIDRINESRAVMMEAKSTAEAMFAPHNEDFGNFSKEELEKVKKTLNSNLKDGRLKNNFGIALSDGSKRNYETTADVQLALKAIDNAIKQKNDAEQKEKSNNYGTQYDKAEKEWKDAKAELKKIEADKEKYSKEQFEAAKRREATASAAFKSLNGDVTGKTEKSAQKEEKAREKQLTSQDRISRELLDLEAKNQAAQIDLMEEGRRKREAVIEREYSDRMLSIRKQREDWIKENKKAGISDLGSNGLTDAQTNALAEAERIAERQRSKDTTVLNEERQAEFRKFLKDFGTFQQQKLAIAEEYADKIDVARRAENNVEIKRLEKERDSAMSKVDISALTGDIDWSQTFAGVGNVLRDIAKDTLGKIDEYMRTDDYKKLGATDKKAYADFASQLRAEVGETSNPFNFKTWSEIEALTKKYRESVYELQNASEAHKAACEELAAAQKEQANATSLDAKKTAEGRVRMAQISVNATADKLDSAKGKKDETGQALGKATNAATLGLNNFATALNEMSGGSLYGFANGLSKLISSFTRADEGVGDLVSTLGGKVGGIVGAVLQLLDTLGDAPAEFIEELLKKVDVAIGNIMTQLPDIIVSVLKGAWNIVGSVFGGIGNWLGFGGDSDRNLERDTERLTASNEALRKAIEGLTDEMGDVKTYELPGVYLKQLENLKTVEANTQEMMYRSGTAYKSGFLGIGGHHSSADKINKGLEDDDWKRISDAAGVKVSRAAEFFSLTSDQMAKVAKYAPEMYAKVKALADDGYKDAAQYMDSYIEFGEEILELEKNYKETLTDISFDSVRDDFKSMLLDMDSDAQSFTDDFSKMMQSAVVEGMMKNEFNDRLQEWYDSFAASIENDGRLDYSEQKDLNDLWNTIANDALEQRNQLKAAMGWKSETESQSSTGGYSPQLSEDTGSLIDGRLTAIQDVLYRIEQLGIKRNELLDGSANMDATTISDLTNASLSDMLKVQADIYVAHVDCRKLLAESYLELQQIRENTGAIIKPINNMTESLKNIEKNTKEMI